MNIDFTILKQAFIKTLFLILIINAVQFLVVFYDTNPTEYDIGWKHGMFSLNGKNFGFNIYRNVITFLIGIVFYYFYLLKVRKNINK